MGKEINYDFLVDEIMAYQLSKEYKLLNSLTQSIWKKKSK